jgi:transcriptional regulator with XRE-family HTH domain
MSMKTRKSGPKFLRAYDRAMLRSAFVSLFWAVISERRKKVGYTLVKLAKELGTNKAEVSRWFRGEPNWTLGTIANIAHALNVELRIEAVDRVSGEVFTPTGLQRPAGHQVKHQETSASPRVNLVKITKKPEGLRVLQAESAAA